MSHQHIVLCSLALTLSACASDPAPQAQLSLTRQTIEQAVSLGVDDEQHELLALAQGKYQQAQGAMAAGEHKRARLLAEQAELDARLAEAQSLSVKNKAQVRDLDHRIARLRQQLRAMR